MPVTWEEKYTYFIGNFQAPFQVVVWVSLRFPSPETGLVCNSFLCTALGCSLGHRGTGNNQRLTCRESAGILTSLSAPAVSLSCQAQVPIQVLCTGTSTLTVARMGSCTHSILTRQQPRTALLLSSFLSKSPVLGLRVAL